MRTGMSGGQATILILLALAFFLLGGIGLTIDASTLYLHRQMAQAAVDAAVEAAASSILNGTNAAALNNEFGAAGFTCTAGSQLTPCYYAELNGLEPGGNDVVHVDFPESVPGVTLAENFDPAAVRVFARRTVSTTLIQLLGASTGSIAVEAIAAVVNVNGPTPIMVMDPDRNAGTPGSRGPFHLNGGPSIQICGGPERSIQVNSIHDSSVTGGSAALLVDLSRAGEGNCGANPQFPNCTGCGAHFGHRGGPQTWPGGGGTLLTGNQDPGYVSAGRRPDPFLTPATQAVTPPTQAYLNGKLYPTFTNQNDGAVPLPGGQTALCTGLSLPCFIVRPGIYQNGLNFRGGTGNRIVFFLPGVYYIVDKGPGVSGLFAIRNQTTARMAQPDMMQYLYNNGIPFVGDAAFGGSIPVDTDTGSGMLVFGLVDQPGDTFQIWANSGSALVGGAVGNSLLGPPDSQPYRTILFWGFPNANQDIVVNHEFQAAGGLNLIGSLYFSSVNATPANGFGDYSRGIQRFNIQGSEAAGPDTFIQGMIISDQLEVAGNGQIQMEIPVFNFEIPELALVQ